MFSAEACKSEATAKGITDMRLGRASGGTEVITIGRGGSILIIAEDHRLLVEDQAGKDITRTLTMLEEEEWPGIQCLCTRKNTIILWDIYTVNTPFNFLCCNNLLSAR